MSEALLGNKSWHRMYCQVKNSCLECFRRPADDTPEVTLNLGGLVMDPANISKHPMAYRLSTDDQPKLFIEVSVVRYSRRNTVSYDIHCIINFFNENKLVYSILLHVKIFSTSTQVHKSKCLMLTIHSSFNNCTCVPVVAHGYHRAGQMAECADTRDRVR